MKHITYTVAGEIDHGLSWNWAINILAQQENFKQKIFPILWISPLVWYYLYFSGKKPVFIYVV